MTRKDYVLLAKALRYAWMEETNQDDIVAEQTIFNVVNTLAATLKQDNPRFNQEHFLAVVRGERDANSHPPRG